MSASQGRVLLTTVMSVFLLKQSCGTQNTWTIVYMVRDYSVL